jgi:predicted ester cyclase
MSVEENRAIARKHFEEVWNKGRVELMDAYYAPALPPEDYNSLEEMKNRRLWWHKAAPGLVFTILDTVAEGDKVVVLYEVEATYSVVPDPPPTTPMLPFGKPVKFRGVDIFHFADGKMVKQEGFNQWNQVLVDHGIYVLAKPEPV